MSYSESLSGTLSAIGATEGTRLRVSKEGRTFEGTLMPHHEFSAPDVLILKVKSGYNVGIAITDSTTVEVIEQPVQRTRSEQPVEFREGLP